MIPCPIESCAGLRTLSFPVSMKILFCGDIMPGGVLPYQERYISPELQAYLDSFDIRIGTLEAAIGTDLAFDPVKMEGRKNIIYARNEDFFRVKEMGFDIVSLANNHVWDLGREGLENTIRILRENGIRYCGAGMDLEEASRPAVIEKDGVRIAILAYCMYGNPWLGYVERAGKEKAGVNPLDMNKVIQDIRKAKREFNFVFVMPHWGKEYQYHPLPECVQMAKQMVEAGADAVLGSHPHQIQPLVRYKGVPICYSMGNFLFPDFYMYPPRPIWYPASIEEVRGVKDVVGYPFPIEEPIRQVWNSVSRYGFAVGLSLSRKQVTASLFPVHSSEENVVSPARIPWAIRSPLLRAKWMLTNRLFRFCVKVKRKVWG